MRSFSTFVQPFPFAFFLMIVVLVGIPIALHDPVRLRNRVFLILLPLYGIGMLVAVVRGAWIGTAVGLLYLGVRRHRILLLGIPVAVIVLLLGPSTSGSNATQDHVGPDPAHRVERQLLRRSATTPSVSGIGSAGAAARQAQRPRGRRAGDTSSRGSAATPRSSPTTSTSCTRSTSAWPRSGSTCSSSSRRSRPRRRASDRTAGDDSAFALGTGAVIVAYAVAGLVATILEILPVYYFWMLIGVTSALAPDRKRGPGARDRAAPAADPEAERSRPRPRSGAAAGVIRG